jgi:hypothetical protein
LAVLFSPVPWLKTLDAQRGDPAIAEGTVEYGGNHSYNTAITEMEDGKVKRARQYFKAPQWRARQIEKM